MLLRQIPIKRIKFEINSKFETKLLDLYGHAGVRCLALVVSEAKIKQRRSRLWNNSDVAGGSRPFLKKGTARLEIGYRVLQLGRTFVNPGLGIEHPGLSKLRRIWATL